MVLRFLLVLRALLFHHIRRIPEFFLSFDKTAEELGWDTWFLDGFVSTTWTLD